MEPTPEEMEWYYSASNEMLEGETMEQVNDRYARCCAHHHNVARRTRDRVDRNRRKRARQRGEYR